MSQTNIEPQVLSTDKNEYNGPMPYYPETGGQLSKDIMFQIAWSPSDNLKKFHIHNKLLCCIKFLHHSTVPTGID